MINIPPEIIEQFTAGNGVIFAGIGLSKEAGLPDWGELIDDLTKELEDCPINHDYHSIAQYYENQWNRNQLLQKIRNRFSIPSIHPTPIHAELVKLPISTIFTTNYDDLLEQSLQAAKCQFDLVVQNRDMSFATATRIQLIKLHGDLNQLESIIITDEDCNQFEQQRTALARLLQTILQTRTALFVGYDVTDPNLKWILQRRGENDQFVRSHYIVQYISPTWAVKDLEKRGLRVINLGSKELGSKNLHDWLQKLNKLITTRRPVYPSQVINDILYRSWLKNNTDKIDIRGIASRGAKYARNLPILELYTELYVKSNKKFTQEDERVSLIDVVASNRCTTIEGDPGSGKTTFLKYLAQTYLVDQKQPLPFLLRLDELNKYLTFNFSQHNKPKWYWLLSYLLVQNEIYNWELTESWLIDRFQQGQVIMLLDSLDEVTGEKELGQIIQIIDQAVQKWPKCRWVVTSRRGVLRGSAVPQDFLTVEIDVLADQEIRAFIRAWVNLLFDRTPQEIVEGSLANQYITDLWHTIRDQKDVRSLARNPVMLTAMAVVHWNEKKLPEARADLYEAIIEWLIKARRELPHRLSKEITKKCYQLLALEMFRHQRGRQTVVGLRWAAERIAPYLARQRKEEHHILQDSSWELSHLSISEKQSDIQRFNLKNIRTLLTEGFNDEELRRLCFEESYFRPVYEQLSQGIGKDKVIDKLIEFAERRELIEMLLDLAKRHNPRKHERHQPYYNLIASSTSSGGTYEESQRAEHQYNQQVEMAEQFLIQEEIDTGIIIRQEGNLKFWHLSFQEYLAACEVSVAGQIIWRKKGRMDENRRDKKRDPWGSLFRWRLKRAAAGGQTGRV